MRIRQVTPEDTGKFIELVKRVDAESDYMLMEPGEREITLDEQRQRLEKIEQDTHSTILVAQNKENELVGYLAAFGGNAKRTRHSVYLVIGITENFRGKGLGTKLFQMIEKWAKERGILRMELTVVCKNHSAVALYKKMGFEIEGTKRASLLINGIGHDEYMMSKLF